MDLQSVLSECMELGVVVDLDLVELSQKSISSTPDQVLTLLLERLLQAKKFEVTEQRHNTQVAELQTQLVGANLKIKELKDTVSAKTTQIETLKSDMQNMKGYSRRYSDQIQETMESDEDYETFDWASGQMPYYSGFYSDCGGNYPNTRETAEKSTCTDDPFVATTELRSQKIATFSSLEKSHVQEEISTSPSNDLDSVRLSNIFPALIQTESQATDENDFEIQMQQILGNDTMQRRSTRPSVNLRSYVCTYCHKKFITSKAFQLHLFAWHFEQQEVHTCEPCRKGWITNSELMRHKARAHKTVVPSFHCRHCGKKFNSYQGRWEHEKMHVGKNRQLERAQCTKCDKSYGTIKTLQIHEKNAHSKK